MRVIKFGCPVVLGVAAAMAVGPPEEAAIERTPVALPGVAQLIEKAQAEKKSLGAIRAPLPEVELVLPEEEKQDLSGIFEAAEELQAAINKVHATEGCDAAFSWGSPSWAVYTKINGRTQQINTLYTAGDAHFHGFIRDVPEGVDYRDEFFGYFNGERYTLPGRNVETNDNWSTDLVLKIPEAVGHPPYTKWPCREDAG